ncbi:MAG TPA: cytochrome b/b6 domain-containing protein [Burkholderiaceae bacterium]|nr:cytochrome b/b6 domain-containing protein [Burkholderiaceae bacterium]
MHDDSPSGYGGFTRFLHWTMAVLVVLQFMKLGNYINDGEHWIGRNIVPWHVSTGALILVLAIVRVWWAVRQRPNRPQPEAMPGMVKLGHRLLYACLLLLPLLGVTFLIGGGYGLTIFGVNLVPRTDVEIPWLAAIGELHSPIALLFVLLVLGHIAAALYHHSFKRDRTLLRMLGR